ncbi:hypothetical protein Ato02nite_074190 [Paractinoplanes toevensis]|uniref:Uncharacterized protein n=1 Tax=Paractinoplanes toevensis TaxID=571911 RepID=A0A919TII8_9ACTN|nr:hypothetical protein Ato02nite_074190 [Actinoplanes toevensis]
MTGGIFLAVLWTSGLPQRAGRTLRRKRVTASKPTNAPGDEAAADSDGLPPEHAAAPVTEPGTDEAPTLIRTAPEPTPASASRDRPDILPTVDQPVAVRLMGDDIAVGVPDGPPPHLGKAQTLIAPAGYAMFVQGILVPVELDEPASGQLAPGQAVILNVTAAR